MKIKIIIFVFFFITLMSVGYAALNSELTISGESVLKISSEIRITDIYIKSSLNGAYEPYGSDFTNVESGNHVTLPNQNSVFTIGIEVTNTSNKNYRLKDVIEILNTNPTIKYEIVDKEALHFSANSIQEIEIKFYYEYLMGTSNSINLDLKYIFEEVNYQVFESLVFTGTQYIETGLMNTGDYIFETEFNQTQYTLNDGGWIISGRTTSAYTLGVFIGKSNVFNGYGGVTSPKTPRLNLNTWYSLYFSRETLLIENYTYSINGGVLIPEEYERSILIGGATAGWNGGSDFRNFIGSINKFKITDAVTGEVIRYFIPAKITEGVNALEVGYWEVIEDKFYPNSGTGSFTVS